MGCYGSTEGQNDDDDDSVTSVTVSMPKVITGAVPEEGGPDSDQEGGPDSEDLDSVPDGAQGRLKKGQVCANRTRGTGCQHRFELSPEEVPLDRRCGRGFPCQPGPGKRYVGVLVKPDLHRPRQNAIRLNGFRQR